MMFTTRCKLKCAIYVTLPISFLFMVAFSQYKNSNVVYNKLKGVVMYKDTEYKYLINNPDKCFQETPFLIIFLKSLPSHFQQRQAIRESWGNMSAWDLPSGVKVIVMFMLGVETKSLQHDLSNMLYMENTLTNDLVQENFVEDFYKLTVKVIGQLKWIKHFCYNTKYFMTSDTDVFINVKNLVMYLQQQQSKNEKIYLGCVHSISFPIRNPNNKYFVPRNIYPGFIYPNYCPGAGYVLSRSAVSFLYSFVPSVPLLFIDDVYVGLLANLGGIAPTHSNKFSCETKINSISCLLDYFITSHGYTASELKDTFMRLKRESPGKCTSVFSF